MLSKIAAACAVLMLAMGFGFILAGVQEPLPLGAMLLSAVVLTGISFATMND